MPRLRGKGKRGERDGSRGIKVGAKGEGGATERAMWEKEERVRGETERSVVWGGYRCAVELDCGGGGGHTGGGGRGGGGGEDNRWEECVRCE